MSTSRPARFALWTIVAVLAVPGAGAGRSFQDDSPDSLFVESMVGKSSMSNSRRIAEMSGNELAELLNRQRRFEDMPFQKQERLREMHGQWLAHPRRDELQATMKRYYEWLKSLNAEERADIKSLSGDERLARVREIRQQQAEEIFGIAGETRLPKKDVSILFDWTRELLTNRRDAIIELYRQRGGRGDERRGRGLEQTNQTSLLFFALNRVDPDSVAGLITPNDIAQLRQRLSPEAVAIIDDQQGESDRQKLVYRWVMSATSAQLNPSIPDRELMDFYDTKMTTEQRKHVDAMTAENRRWMIARFYRLASRDDGRGPFPFGPGPRSSRDDKEGPDRGRSDSNR